jgi:hypothetical protein
VGYRWEYALITAVSQIFLGFHNSRAMISTSTAASECVLIITSETQWLTCYVFQILNSLCPPPPSSPSLLRHPLSLRTPNPLHHLLLPLHQLPSHCMRLPITQWRVLAGYPLRLLGFVHQYLGDHHGQRSRARQS